VEGRNGRSDKKEEGDLTDLVSAAERYVSRCESRVLPRQEKGKGV